jgi:hypothetical protein
MSKMVNLTVYASHVLYVVVITLTSPTFSAVTYNTIPLYTILYLQYVH